MPEVLTNPSAIDLKQIDDRDEAYRKLSGPQFERWEKIKELEHTAEENQREMQEDAAIATDTLVRADVSDLATDVTVFGNTLSCYYDPESQQVRDAAERVGDICGVDADDPGDLEGASVEDVADDDLPAIKGALVDLITAAVVEWRGTPWGDLADDTQAEIRQTIQKPPEAGGWGVAGLMDAFVEIYVSVEDNRSERMERIQKFRDETRRGDR